MLEFHSVLYTQLLIPVILLTPLLMFLCADWSRTWAIYSVIQHSTPRLQGACACGILVSPRR